MKRAALDPVLEKAARASADPARARHGFDQLIEAQAHAAGEMAPPGFGPNVGPPSRPRVKRATQRPSRASASARQPAQLSVDPAHARLLAAVFSGSQAMGELLIKHPEWAKSTLAHASLSHPRKAQGLRRDVAALVEPAIRAGQYAEALSQLRLFKQREWLRIAARDLARLGDAPQIIQELSDVADVCLSATLEICRQQQGARFGQPWHQDADGHWQPTQFSVLGLGKLGGQELNYSSDVDVLFIYSEEGCVFTEPPRAKARPAHGLTNHQFFKRLAESFIAEVARASAQGALFRIDLRLRPEGDAGPLVRSLPSYENYYAQWGQTWERMMLLKARGVAGDGALAAEFLEMVHSFRYPRSLGQGTLREIAAMKTRIENEVVRSGEMDRNIKLGRGGIREIEFVVQTAQVLKAGRLPFLQGAQTLPALQQMVRYQLLSPPEARDLMNAYSFLRDVEHRLQMENNLQTHTIPAERVARARLARLMGFDKESRFEATLKQHTTRVRGIYEKFVGQETPAAASPYPTQFGGAETAWRKLLAEHGFKDVDKSFRLLREFAEGPGYMHVSQRTTELAMQLVPRLLSLAPASVSSFGFQVSSSPRGVPSFEFQVSGSEDKELQLSNPTRSGNPKPETRNQKPETRNSGGLSDPDRVLARLDSFITAYGARAVMFETWTANPQIFELLLLLFDRSEFLAEMAIRTPDLVDDLVMSGHLRRSKSAVEILRELRHGCDDKDQRHWLRRYHQAEFMRIGLRSILGLADVELNFIELTALADACLEYALETVLRQHQLKATPLLIVGLGKLGGRELNYGSDLDITFVAADQARKSLPRLQKIAAAVMDLLSSPTELGIAFVTDARLRPDGEKGLLVNTLTAYEDYYRQRAQLWEIQALTRVRAIAGDKALGEKFQQLASALTNLRIATRPVGGPQRLACWTPTWKNEIARMRARIEKERTRPGQDALAFKTGTGGLIDAEFIAQTMCLEHGWHEPNTLRALERTRDEGALPQTDVDALLANYRQLRRLENILRRWSFEGETTLPEDPAAYRRVSIRCGFATPEAFRDALAGWRRSIREVYRRVFPGDA